MRRLTALFVVVVAFAAVSLLSDSAHAAGKTRFVTIGTGGVTGVYYPAGGAIAKMLGKKRKVYGVRMAVESTGGSVFNINAVMAGDLDFGIAQSDRQYQALKGMGEWEKKGPQTNLRAVFSLYSEMVTLVAAEDSGIKVLSDIKGKRINIGNPGSGQRGNAIDALTTAGIDWQKDIRAEGLKAAECAKMLQDSRIDAFFYTVGHPAGAITEATAGKRTVRFVPITGMDALFAKSPYYAKAMIPVMLYPNCMNAVEAKKAGKTEAGVETLGMVTTVITSSKVPDDVVYAVTKEVFANLAVFKKLHPAFGVLKKEDMAKNGLSAPIHPGALKYYKEAGLVK